MYRRGSGRSRDHAVNRAAVDAGRKNARPAQYAERPRLAATADRLQAANTRHAGIALLRLATMELWLQSLAEPVAKAAAAQ